LSLKSWNLQTFDSRSRTKRGKGHPSKSTTWNSTIYCGIQIKIQGICLQSFLAQLHKILKFTIYWFDTDQIGAVIFHMSYWIQSKYKIVCQFKFWKGFVGTTFWGGVFYVWLTKRLEIWMISQFLYLLVSLKVTGILNISTCSLLIMKILIFLNQLNYLRSYTSNWSLELIQLLHSTNFVYVLFQIEHKFFKTFQ
jgi:hypothetical protein